MRYFGTTSITLYHRVRSISHKFVRLVIITFVIIYCYLTTVYFATSLLLRSFFEGRHHVWRQIHQPLPEWCLLCRRSLDRPLSTPRERFSSHFFPDFTVDIFDVNSALLFFFYREKQLTLCVSDYIHNIRENHTCVCAHARNYILKNIIKNENTFIITDAQVVAF